MNGKNGEFLVFMEAEDSAEGLSPSIPRGEGGLLE